MVDNSELRRRLQEITDAATKQQMNADQRAEMIQELSANHPHSIRQLPEQRLNYNCFEYAFELVGSHLYEHIAEVDCAARRNVFFAGSEFARFLIETGTLIKVGENEARPGDVVTYFDDLGVPQHAGKIASDDQLINSKWGGGPLLEHRLWEVPESYGKAVRFFRAIPADKAEQVFSEFCRSRDDFDEFVAAFDLKDLFE